jgi:hypothetical protein
MSSFAGSALADLHSSFASAPVYVRMSLKQSIDGLPRISDNGALKASGYDHASHPHPPSPAAELLRHISPWNAWTSSRRSDGSTRCFGSGKKEARRITGWVMEYRQPADSSQGRTANNTSSVGAPAMNLSTLRGNPTWACRRTSCLSLNRLKIVQLRIRGYRARHLLIS